MGRAHSNANHAYPDHATISPYISRPHVLPLAVCPASGFRCPGAAADTQFQGSKPIIVTTGSRVSSSVVKVEEVATELRIDAELSSIDPDALRLQLAEVYGVPASSITLSLSAGSVVVQIQIASTAVNGTGQGELLAATLAAVNSSTLSAALELPAVISAAPTVTTRNESVVEQLDCPTGHWVSSAATIVAWLPRS